MQHVITEKQNKIFTITINREKKHNAFDDILINELQTALDEAKQDASTNVILLKSNGKNFSAGADLAWMQRMINYSEEENIADALKLAQVLDTLYSMHKPTIVMVQGATYGGGLGLISACDIAIAAKSAKFCFSEVKLGLIPAIISPYIIDAIGAKAAKWLFISADLFNAQRAYELQLVQYLVSDEELLDFTCDYANKLANLPQNSLMEAKALVKKIQNLPFDTNTQRITAELIAKKRISHEAQVALVNFLKENYAKNSN